jgi:hypothetical protein
MDALTARLASVLGDRYRFERELGVGGMATVHLARDLKHGRDVAIKIMRGDLAASLGPERFSREIELLARLQHPNILGFFDSGEVSGALYYVMPYASGGSLRARLDRERELPVDDAVRILQEVASALSHAHAAGIVHRDIKPENVLFSAGHTLVADFGIARILSGNGGNETLTVTGYAIGSPKYMSPEQATGERSADHRSDIYSLGALAYEMLAGTPPFVAGTVRELIDCHLHAEPVSLSRRRPSVPAGLEELVMRCLAKRPADRWQSIGDLLVKLERTSTSDGPISTRPRLAGTTTAHLIVSGGLAAKLDRKVFDPRMIGDSLEYLDNLVESDILVMMLNAAWLDGSDLEPHVRKLPYRCIVPTLYGFGPQARHRFELSLDDHLVLLAELLRVKIDEVRPTLVILGGFSSAADLILRLAARSYEGVRAPDGVLSLGSNQAQETCFVSRVLARLDLSQPERLLRDLCSLGQRRRHSTIGSSSTATWDASCHGSRTTWHRCGPSRDRSSSHSSAMTEVHSPRCIARRQPGCVSCVACSRIPRSVTGCSGIRFWTTWTMVFWVATTAMGR